VKKFQNREFLDNNILLKEIIFELEKFNNKKNEKLENEINLTDKLLLINENEENDFDNNLIKAEKNAANNFDGNFGGEEINIEMMDVNNFDFNGKDKDNFCKRKFGNENEYKHKEILPEKVSDQIRKPYLFYLSTSELNYIYSWNVIKKILLFCFIFFALAFYCLVPLVISGYRQLQL